jgi:hypothetical protein
MNLFGSKTLLRLLAAFALLTFAGDVAAHSIADAGGTHFGAPSSHSSQNPDKGPCSHCACATHTGAAVMGELATRIPKAPEVTDLLPSDAGLRPTRLAASIDHPPQLA